MAKSANKLVFLAWLMLACTNFYIHLCKSIHDQMHGACWGQNHTTPRVPQKLCKGRKSVLFHNLFWVSFLGRTGWWWGRRCDRDARQKREPWHTGTPRGTGTTGIQGEFLTPWDTATSSPVYELLVSRAWILQGLIKSWLLLPSFT